MPALLLSLKSVWLFEPLLLIVAFAAFDVLKNPTSELGKAAPEPLLLIVEFAAVVLPRKLIVEVAFVFVRTELPAVAVSSKVMLLPEPVFVT